MRVRREETADRTCASEPRAWGIYWLLSPSGYGVLKTHQLFLLSLGQDKRCLASQMSTAHRPKASGMDHRACSGPFRVPLALSSSSRKFPASFRPSQV